MPHLPEQHGGPVDRVVAPRCSGEIVCLPSPALASELAARNAQVLAESTVRIGTWPLAEFRQWARLETLAAAGRWMQDVLGIAPPEIPSNNSTFSLTGHQPQLTHPGVWLKNLAVWELARRDDGVGLNLIVDPDTAGPPGIDVPTGSRAAPRLERILYDDPQPLQPWEELQLQNRDAFTTFPERVAERMRGWNVQPVLSDVWPAAIATVQRTGRIADGLTAARVEMERQFGCRNFEIPISLLCGTAPFREFVSALCRDHQRLFKIYNAAAAAYRLRYRIRNSRHPVPDLEQREDLYELPFWYYRPGTHARQRVFIRRNGKGLELFADRERLALLPEDETIGMTLAELGVGERLRTRALTTTLYARLCLGDLFVHGIGGARYDEITNEIIENLFGLTAPSFLTLSATLHLPLGADPEASDSARQLQTRLRDLIFNPDRHLSGLLPDALCEAKTSLIAEDREARSQWRKLAPDERQQRWQAARERDLGFRRVRQQALPLAGDARTRLQQQLLEAQRQEQANRVLTSREYAAVLFPREMLLDLWQSFSR